MDFLFKIDSEEGFTVVLEDVLNNLYDINHISLNNLIDVSHMKVIKEEVKEIILNTNLKMDEVNKLMSERHCDSEKLKIFTAHLEKRKSKLLHSTLVHYNCEFGKTLNSFDWKLKLVCGTSELKTFSYTLLQLALYTVSVNHNPGLRIHEMTKDMLLKFIETLENQLEEQNLNDKEQ